MKIRSFFLFALLLLSLNSYGQERKLSAEETSRYEKLMQEGEILLSEQNLSSAKDKFKEAILIDPYAQLTKEKMKAIDERLQRDYDKKLKVADLVKEGDALFAQGNLEEALKKFEMVLILKAGDTYSQNRIVEILQLRKK
mgnify:FL=1